MLRRLKSDVEHSLLPKIETKLYIGMSEMQRYFYKKILSRDTVALNQVRIPNCRVGCVHAPTGFQ